MNVAKWVLLAILAGPLLELAAFVAVAAQIGLLWALLIVVASSMAGMALLRRAGGAHIARVRVAMGQGDITALRADGVGGLILLGGILLAIPGFITDFLGLLVLVAALYQGLLRNGFGGVFATAAAPRSDGVVDLEPEQWRRVPEPTLPNRSDRDRP